MHAYTHKTQVSAGSLSALSAVPHLRKLALLGCKLGDDGAAALAHHLQHASEMRVTHEPGENQVCSL